MSTIDTYYELPVIVREKGDTFIATCNGLRSSCTYSPELAAKRVVAAALNLANKVTFQVRPCDVQIQPFTMGPGKTEISGRVSLGKERP
jgi:hypothetical protein